MVNETGMEEYIEIRCYIKYNLYYGHKFNEIKRVLIDNGWPEDLINKAYKEVKELKSYVPKPKNVGKFVKHENHKTNIPPPP